jgi:hypothetical protein
MDSVLDEPPLSTQIVVLTIKADEKSSQLRPQPPVRERRLSCQSLRIEVDARLY